MGAFYQAIVDVEKHKRDRRQIQRLPGVRISRSLPCTVQPPKDADEEFDLCSIKAVTIYSMLIYHNFVECLVKFYDLDKTKLGLSRKKQKSTFCAAIKLELFNLLFQTTTSEKLPRTSKRTLLTLITINRQKLILMSAAGRINNKCFLSISQDV